MDKAARQQFYEGAGEFAPYLGVTTEIGEFIVSVSDGGVEHSLFIKQGRPEFRVLRRTVQLIGDVEGKTFVDVGANIGTEAVAALAVHGFGSAVCCEPHPANVRRLGANLALNGLLDRTRIVAAAVSDHDGGTALAALPDRTGKGWVGSREQIETYYRKHPAKPTRRGGPRRPPEVSDVPTITLDELGIEDAGLIWIDVEGHEGHVLRGAKSLVGRVPIVCEYDPANLRERGDLDAFTDAAMTYSHFCDIRRGEHVVDGIDALAGRTADLLSSGRFTDLLLFHQVP